MLGELGLDGRIRPVAGTIAAAEGAARAGSPRVLCSAESSAGGVARGRRGGRRQAPRRGRRIPPRRGRDRAAVPGRRPAPAARAPRSRRGPRTGTRPSGPRASGRRVPQPAARGPARDREDDARAPVASILPPLPRSEALEVMRIHSVAATLRAAAGVASPHRRSGRLITAPRGRRRRRRYRPPAGEVSLAHRGVLLLDELPEFPRSVLEALRQPLEDGVVSVARVGGRELFPARFRLVADDEPLPVRWARPCGPRLLVHAVPESRPTEKVLARAARSVRPRRRDAEAARGGARAADARTETTSAASRWRSARAESARTPRGHAWSSTPPRWRLTHPGGGRYRRRRRRAPRRRDEAPGTAVRDRRPASAGSRGDGMDAHDLERLRARQRGQDRRRAARDRLPCPGGTCEQEVVAPRGRELEGSTAALRPRTSARSAVGRRARVVVRGRRLDRVLASEVSDGLGDVPDANRLDARQRRLPRRLRRAEEARKAGASGAFGGHDRPHDGPDAAVEPELADTRVLREPVGGTCPDAASTVRRSRLEARSLLAERPGARLTVISLPGHSRSGVDPAADACFASWGAVGQPTMENDGC